MKNEHLQHLASKNRNVAGAEAPNTISHQPSSAMIKKHAHNAWNQGLSETRELLVAYTNAQWKAKGLSTGRIGQIYDKVATGAHGFVVSQQGSMFNHELYYYRVLSSGAWHLDYALGSMEFKSTSLEKDGNWKKLLPGLQEWKKLQEETPSASSPPNPPPPPPPGIFAPPSQNGKILKALSTHFIF